MINFEQNNQREHAVMSMVNEKISAAGKTDKTPLRAQFLLQGKCLHMISGLISYGLCAYGHNCTKCALDQMIEDTSYLPKIRSAVLSSIPV